jgi:hypothetical protein
VRFVAGIGLSAQARRPSSRGHLFLVWLALLGVLGFLAFLLLKLAEATSK